MFKMFRAPAADMAAAIRGEKQQDEKNIMEDQEDWQEHPWEDLSCIDRKKSDMIL